MHSKKDAYIGTMKWQGKAKAKGWTKQKALRKNGKKPAQAPKPVKRATAAKQNSTGKKRKQPEPKVHSAYKMTTARLKSAEKCPCNTVSVDGHIVYCIDE